MVGRQSYTSQSVPFDISSMHLAPYEVTTTSLTRFPKLHFTAPGLFWNCQFVLLNPFTFLFTQPPILPHSGKTSFSSAITHAPIRTHALCSPGTLGNPAMASEARGQFAAVKSTRPKEDQFMEALPRNLATRSPVIALSPRQTFRGQLK